MLTRGPVVKFRGGLKGGSWEILALFLLVLASQTPQDPPIRLQNAFKSLQVAPKNLQYASWGLSPLGDFRGILLLASFQVILALSWFVVTSKSPPTLPRRLHQPPKPLQEPRKKNKKLQDAFWGHFGVIFRGPGRTAKCTKIVLPLRREHDFKGFQGVRTNMKKASAVSCFRKLFSCCSEPLKP